MIKLCNCVEFQNKRNVCEHEADTVTVDVERGEGLSQVDRLRRTNVTPFPRHWIKDV